MKPMDRREFVRLGSTGLTVLFSVSPCVLAQPARRPGYPTDLNAYLRIAPDGAVTCLVGKIEMGQGAITALAQLLADELEVNFGAVTMVMGDTDQCPWDAGTFGSQSIRIFGHVLRAAAAEARAVLLQLAAERLDVPVEDLQVEEGQVQVKANPGVKVSYGQLVQGRRIESHLEQKPTVKDVSQHRVIGKPIPRPDAVEKVTGKAKFAGDIRLPGMLYARLVRPPAHGSRLDQADVSAAELVTGARVIRDGDDIAVLHEYPDEADRAVRLVKAEWQIPEKTIDERTIFDHLVKAAPPAQVVAEGGNLDSGAALAAHVFEQSYFNSYVAHAATETHTAVAEGKDGKFTVWVSTQTPFPLKGQVAQALGIPPESVRIIVPFVGGGFGGKSANRQAIEAARLAKLVGRPVQVAWNRQEEFFYDTFRPAAVVKIRSGVDARGRIVLWDFEVYCAGDREAKSFYDVPNHRTVSRGGWGGPPGLHPFGVGPWRAPSVNTNTFARESQVDIMAVKAGIDPLEFRLKNVADARMRRVLNAAAEKFGWSPSKLPSGRGFGVACAMYLGTYVATMAEVAVNRTSGAVQVKRVVCAQDMGLVINPKGAHVQTEGAVMMGLGYALTEEVRFRGGEILDRNFDSYELPRFSWLPKIESVLVEARQEPPQGCGEPPIVCMGAVVANAIFDAVGVRLSQLPMTRQRVKEGLEAKR